MTLHHIAVMIDLTIKGVATAALIFFLWRKYK